MFQSERTRCFPKSCAVLLLIILAAGLASADTIISFSAWFPLANGPNPGDSPRTLATTDWDGTTQSVTLPKFDTSLGTLNSVTLQIYADMDSFGNVQNTGDTQSVINSWVATLGVRIIDPSETAPYTASSTFLLEANPALISILGQILDPTASIAYGSAANPQITSDSKSINPANLSAYEGVGSIVFPLFTTTHTLADVVGGNLVLTQNTSARAEVTITYDYTPADEAPEPASLVLVGGALAGVGLVRFRKR